MGEGYTAHKSRWRLEHIAAGKFSTWRCRNRRTDHAVFRALTRAPGFISATPERIDIHLLPALTIEPTEKERIGKFPKVCEHRAAAMAAFRDGPAVRYRLLLDPAEINALIRRR